MEYNNLAHYERIDSILILGVPYHQKPFMIQIDFKFQKYENQ